MNEETRKRIPNNSFKPLSPVQEKVLRFITETYEGTRFYPTYREILNHFGWNSTNFICQLMKVLERKGVIERRPNRDYRVLP